MTKSAISTEQAPRAIGPYSQGIVAEGRMIFCSGQIPLDPSTQQLVSSDIQTETNRALDNLGAVLAAAGASFEDVVRTTIFLTDLSHFATVNEVYGKRFTVAAPARVTVGVSQLPKGARVEIDAIAVL
ncbi:MAG: RidA family protein [Deltaproteobacteria bacterium]|nr:RidA family protein [Deltaproteobacteria bacterium]